MDKTRVIQKVREALDKYESSLSEINQKVWIILFYAVYTSRLLC